MFKMRRLQVVLLQRVSFVSMGVCCVIEIAFVVSGRSLFSGESSQDDVNLFVGTLCLGVVIEERRQT